MVAPLGPLRAAQQCPCTPLVSPDEAPGPNEDPPVTAMTLPSQSKVNVHAITTLKLLEYRYLGLPPIPEVVLFYFILFYACGFFPNLHFPPNPAAPGISPFNPCNGQV